jgi:hypothetical protein
MSFMAEYLPAPLPAAAPQGGLVSLSLPRHGGSGGSIHSFKPVAQSSFSVPSRGARSVGGRSQLDPKPQEHTPIWASSSRSGRFTPLSEYGGRPHARGGLSPSSIPSLVGYGGRHGSCGGWSPSSASTLVGGLLPHHLKSPTHSEISNGWGSDSADIQQDSSKNSFSGAACLSPLGQFTTFLL